MKQQGFILVTVLLFLFILSLLGISALTNSQLQLRMSNNFVAQLQQKQAVEAGLHTGEMQLQRLADDALPKEYYAQPWQAKQYFTIRYNQMEVHYIIEPLRLSSLACLQGQTKQLQQGAYYRVTAWTVDLAQQPLIMQTTYLRPLQEPCVTTEKLLQPGRLSWREF